MQSSLGKGSPLQILMSHLHKTSYTLAYENWPAWRLRWTAEMQRNEAVTDVVNASQRDLQNCPAIGSRPQLSRSCNELLVNDGFADGS